MNNYQAQQFWNDINSIVGFLTPIIFLGFMVEIVRYMPGNPDAGQRSLTSGQIIVPDVNTFISPNTMQMLEHEGLLHDDRFIGLSDYLQEYTNLAYLGKEYPNHKVDKLFQQSFQLSQNSILHLHARITYWMQEEDFQEYRLYKEPEKIELARKNLKAAREAMRSAEKTLRLFYDAKTRMDKVIAIDCLIVVFHLSGFLLNELFLFPPFHEPTQKYVSEILTGLAK